MKLEEYIKEQKALLKVKPSGFFGNWAWYVKMKREYEKIKKGSKDGRA